MNYKYLHKIIKNNTKAENIIWLQSKINIIISELSTKELYLTYSLIASKFKPDTKLNIEIDANDLKSYLKLQKADIKQISRIYLLISVLENNEGFFYDKVANIIQVADTNELETFLKFLILLPNPEKYKYVAIDALRTNITPVFDAISVNNPYPAIYFDDQQWNQMFLKAAFMERDLTTFHSIDKRGNENLSRIISDYAHERWSAGRTVNPYFWRPTYNFIEGPLIEDMQRLFKSNDVFENKAAALCCYNSNNNDAQKMLEQYPDLLREMEENILTWNTLKN